MEKSETKENIKIAIQIKNKESIIKSEENEIQENNTESVKTEIHKNSNSDKKSLLKIIKHGIKKTARWTSKLLVIVSGFGVIYFIINLLANYSFKSACAIFYGVPAKYFHKIIDEELLFIACALLFVVGSFIPIFLKIRMTVKNEKDKFKTALLFFIGLIFSILVGLIIIVCLPVIFRNSFVPEFVQSLARWLLNFYILPCIVCVLIFIILFFMAKKKEYDLTIMKISCICIFLLFLFICLPRLTMPINDKTTYEIVSVQDDSYVVLTEYDNKNLCVKYDVDSNKNFTLYTGEYYFFSKEDAKYSYVTMNTPPKIKNESYVYDLSK